ncbi:MAG: winged helix-turn-helix transcriptional regulator [bacterium]
MNEKITDILHILDKEDNPSQREIAKKTGISLGLVNTLIKKCAKQGLVQIDKLNSRNIKYVLTPAGIKKITKKTINYVERSYKAIQKIQREVKELASRHIQGEKEIHLLKKEDEIYNLVKKTLDDIGVSYNIIDCIEKTNKLNKIKNDIVIYHWDPELETENDGLELINIFRN